MIKLTIFEGHFKAKWVDVIEMNPQHFAIRELNFLKKSVVWIAKTQVGIVELAFNEFVP